MYGSIAMARAEIKKATKDTDVYRKQLENDLTEMSTYISYDHDKSVASDRVLHHLADALHAEVDNENDLAADLTSAIIKDESAMKQIIEDTRVINAAEKADLALEQISSYASIARDTANLAADAAEVIPFGASVAGVIRTGADTADLIAETATTIKRSGITRTLSNVVTNLHTGELSPVDLLTQSMAVASDVDSLVRELKTIPQRRERRLDLTFASASDPTPALHDSEYYATYGVEGAPMCYVVRDSRSPYYARIKIDQYGLMYEFLRRKDDGIRMSNGKVSLTGSKRKIANKSEMHSLMAICKLFGSFNGISYNVNTVRGVIETLILMGTVVRESLSGDTYDTYVRYKSELDHDETERSDHTEMITHLKSQRNAWKLANADRVDLIPKDSRTDFINQMRAAHLKLLFVEANDYRVLGCRYGPVSKPGTLKIAFMIGGCSNNERAVVQMATQQKNFVVIVQNENISMRPFTITNDGGLKVSGGDMIFIRMYVKPDMNPRLYMQLDSNTDGSDVPVVGDNHHPDVQFDRPYKHRYMEMPAVITNETVTYGAYEWSDYNAPNWTLVPDESS
ncbi:VP4 [Callinectes sapidus reovirus 2]|uniref:VP4 n=1 Tax=Callinectes sapidus reovirus 2 TaxID=2789658 RepID=A0A7U3SUP0_9REOV|nr:VP4 [Callinectes sapidus reovirus 2]